MLYLGQVVWAKINNWAGDISWVKDAKHVTSLGHNLRVVDFGPIQITEIRQGFPLPEPVQPVNGHRLVYYILSGAVYQACALPISGYSSCLC